MGLRTLLTLSALVKTVPFRFKDALTTTLPPSGDLTRLLVKLFNNDVSFSSSNELELQRTRISIPFDFRQTSLSPASANSLIRRT